MKKRNPFATIELYVGKLKPINDGVYSRQEITKEYKHTQKVHVRHGEYYFHKKF